MWQYEPLLQREERGVQNRLLMGWARKKMHKEEYWKRTRLKDNTKPMRPKRAGWKKRCHAIDRLSSSGIGPCKFSCELRRKLTSSFHAWPATKAATRTAIAPMESTPSEAVPKRREVEKEISKDSRIRWTFFWSREGKYRRMSPIIHGYQKTIGLPTIPPKKVPEMTSIGARITVIKIPEPKLVLHIL